MTIIKRETTKRPTLNEKQEFYRHIMHAATMKQQQFLCCLLGVGGTGI